MVVAEYNLNVTNAISGIDYDSERDYLIASVGEDNGNGTGFYQIEQEDASTVSHTSLGDNSLGNATYVPATDQYVFGGGGFTDSWFGIDPDTKNQQWSTYATSPQHVAVDKTGEQSIISVTCNQQGIDFIDTATNDVFSGNSFEGVTTAYSQEEDYFFFSGAGDGGFSGNPPFEIRAYNSGGGQIWSKTIDPGYENIRPNAVEIGGTVYLFSNTGTQEYWAIDIATGDIISRNNHNLGFFPGDLSLDIKNDIVYALDRDNSGTFGVWEPNSVLNVSNFSGSGDYISSPTYNEETVKVWTAQFEGSVRKIDIERVPGNLVSGTLSFDGNPVENATVEARVSSDDSLFDSGVSDASGTYSLVVDDGTYDLTATSADFTDSPSVDNATINGASTADFQFTQPKPAEVTGTVTDANNNPVGGVTVSDSFGNSTVTGSDGSFTLTAGISDTLIVSSILGTQSTEIATEPNGSNSGLSFQFGGAEVTVKDPDGTPLSDVEVNIGGNTYTTDNTGVARAYQLAITEYDVAVQRTLTGQTVTPVSGSVDSLEVQAGKLARLTLQDAGNGDRVSSLPIREATGGSVSLSKDNGNAEVILVDGSKDMFLVLGGDDRRYKTITISPDVNNGEIFSEELSLERKIAIGNK